MNLTQWVNDNNIIGRSDVGDTPQNKGECVGLVEAWFDTLGLPHVWGNACDMPDNADRGAFDVVNNSPSYVPPVGASVHWPAGWGGSSVGHTAIVDVGTNVGELHVIEQNDRIGGGNGSCRRYTFNYAYGLTAAQIKAGWPRFVVPKVLTAQPPAPQGEPPMTGPEETEAYEIVLGREPEVTVPTGRTAMQFITDAKGELDTQRAQTASDLQSARDHALASDKMVSNMTALYQLGQKADREGWSQKLTDYDTEVKDLMQHDVRQMNASDILKALVSKVLTGVQH